MPLPTTCVALEVWHATHQRWLSSTALSRLSTSSRTMLDVGEPIVVENPQYQGAREIFKAAGAKIIPVAVDAEGLVTPALPERARLAFITPSHQFPTGTVLPLARRLALLAWARRANAVIVEDDYDGEFRYEGQAVEPLRTLD